MKINDEVVFEGKKYTVDGLFGDNVLLSATGLLSGYSKVDRLVEADRVTLSKNQQLANEYNCTPRDIEFEWSWFVENEGYLDNGDKCGTFGLWLTRRLGFSGRLQAEPYQKGDLNYGL